uniref:Uncharacterized protein n=1 Tax=Avena sativa TaxID=4498 RepID=A0ACD5VEW4_AVESA
MAATCQSLQEREELRPYDGCDPMAYGGHGQVLLPRQASTAPPAGQPEMSSSSTGSGRSATEARALKIHSEAERRRRERINAHLAALSRMIPDTMQMDKATLLARVVDQVKHLKRRASEATQLPPAIPPETDEVSVECYFVSDFDDSGMYIMASVSCDDRPDLVGCRRACQGSPRPEAEDGESRGEFSRWEGAACLRVVQRGGRRCRLCWTEGGCEAGSGQGGFSRADVRHWQQQQQ